MKQYSFIASPKPKYDKYIDYLREKKSSAILLHDIMKAEDYKDILCIIFPEVSGPKGGRPREWPSTLLLKVYVFQAMENLSAEKMEREIRGNKEVRVLLELELDGIDGPDANTLRNFSETLARTGADKLVWQRHQEILDELGLRAQGGQHIDSSIFPQKRQLNTHRENRLIQVGRRQVEKEDAEAEGRARKAKARKEQRKNRKAGKPNPIGRPKGSTNKREEPPKESFEEVLLDNDHIPPGWNKHKIAQKEFDGRTTVKRFVRERLKDKSYLHPDMHFGIKMHVSSDVRFNLAREQKTTPANTFDGHELPNVLDERNLGKGVYTDKIYGTHANAEHLRERGFEDKGLKKKPRGRDYTEAEKEENTKNSKIRVGIEHLNGAVKNAMSRVVIRCVGIKRAGCRVIGMLMGYNYKQVHFLLSSGRVYQG